MPTATSRGSRALEEEYRDTGGYQAESEARTITAGLGLANDRLALPVRALSGGERRRLELARILFGGSDLLMLDEPTNHLDADAKHWLMKFLAAYRGALHGGEPRPRAARRVDHADPASRSGRGRRVPGDVFAVPRRPRRRTRSACTALAGAAGAEIKRLKTLADSMRGQTAKRARKAKTLDTRVGEARREEGRGPDARADRAVPVPRAAAQRARRCWSGRSREGLRGTAGVRGRHVRRGTGRAPADHGAERRRQDQPAADPRGGDRRGRGDVPVRARRGPGYYAQEHEGIHDGVDVLDAHARGVTGRGPGSCDRCSACSV